MGVNERDAAGGTIYNTQITSGPTGRCWAGTASSCRPAASGWCGAWATVDPAVYDTPFGRLGGLICWENYMPLARYSMYAQGVDVYVAPTWDNSDMWVATLRHIAKEGRLYVIGVAPCSRGGRARRRSRQARELWGGEEDWMSRGFTEIVGPGGDVLAGPLMEKRASLRRDRPGQGAASRHQFDPVGHYSAATCSDSSWTRSPRAAVSLGEES